MPLMMFSYKSSKTKQKDTETLYHTNNSVLATISLAFEICTMVSILEGVQSKKKVLNKGISL